MEKFLNQMKHFIKSWFCFLIACILLPLLLISFVCVHFSTELVNYVLSIKYPTITISKSKKIRTLIDTPRNAGIFHFLLDVKGQCDFEHIKRVYVDHLTELRDKAGFFKFPKLRQKLVTCWGNYAWVKDTSSFNINNHVILSSSTYRGRPVNDENIQEFVSELVTKYIPSDQPQWQVIVIPTASKANPLNTQLSTEADMLPDRPDHYYILLKVHHLLIAEEEDLYISEMLMLNGGRKVIELDDFGEIKRSDQNLSYFVRKPEHIQHLIQHIGKLIIKRWNEFIYEFESLETPDGYRRIQITNITQLLSVLLITAVNLFINYCKTMARRKKMKVRATQMAIHYKDHEHQSRGKLIQQLLLHELDRYNLSWQVAFDAIRNSCCLSNITKTCTKMLWRANMNHFVYLPYNIYCELVAFLDLLFKGQTQRTATFCGRLSVYLPLLIFAQVEFWKICYEVFMAPVNIYEELFENPSKESNILQMKSYSGRKIVSFSKSINAKELRKRNNFSPEVRESDFALGCLAGAIRDYFEMYEKTAGIPRILNTTCRTIAKGYLTENAGDKFDAIGGVVFLQLPLRVPDREHARQIHNIVETIRSKQIMVYLASMAQTRFDFLTAIMPSVITKVFINYFAYNFPVTITEIYGATSEFKTNWGDEVEDVLLFRPPQSKTCLSLNIHRFGDKYRLAIMADTQLGPDHAKIVRSFENYMEETIL